MVAITIATHAQEEPEYRMELGAGIGLINYVGDFNSSLVKGFQPWASILAKGRAITSVPGIRQSDMNLTIVSRKQTCVLNTTSGPMAQERNTGEHDA